MKAINGKAKLINKKKKKKEKAINREDNKENKKKGNQEGRAMYMRKKIAKKQ